MLAKLNIKAIISSTILILGGLSIHAQADNRFYQKPQQTHDRFQSHSYIYYPTQQAYYAPDTRLWYWNAGNRWHSAYVAPRFLNIDFRIGGIPIRLNTALPYHDHAYVVRNYHYNHQYAYNTRHDRKYYKARNYYYNNHHHKNNRHRDD